ncbi:uncharacterized protein Z518_04268 [Rhinocladiella mackenziei CBS 650.93]|uniref:Nitronate monooxygenase domain-containing protein n=1 Tax=Rhinocladiella mackenziei CBS 650.93 TaxID=1442369 RepID=A0A0D2H7B1_9EURO|nr:uncharacterized protein Z518_04268 [Rhinocladiella mackenziei CBS 650.93]KIX06293.1 hypothetical protein Z518_04268 [Rhinocladiella mackenziei CBS 650.93]
MATAQGLQKLKAVYPFLQAPVIVSAPMRIFAGPELAVATSRAGGLGFIGPGVHPTDLEPKLEKVHDLLKETPVTEQSEMLPVGVGFQLFDGDLEVAAAAVRKYKPIAAWLFVPANGQHDIDRWASKLRRESPGTQIWLQIGSLPDAIVAASSKHAPDVMVVQGIDAGGHGLKKGAGILSLLPEVADHLRRMGFDIPLFGAGGIADGRGVAAVLATGVAAGAVMGTRFLASKEAEVKKGYQEALLGMANGGHTTVRTTLFDRLQGRDDWPEQYDGRAMINASVMEDEVGMPLEENKLLFEEALKGGLPRWGFEGRLTAYMGTAVGLVRTVDSAQDIINQARNQAKESLRQGLENLVD